MEMKNYIRSKVNDRGLDWIFTQRFSLYMAALAIRIFFALIFMDPDDGPVFIETSRDILLDRRTLYYEGSLQNKFNYFPLAFLAILPGMAIYYLIGIENSYLLRLFSKLPFIIGDLVLSYVIIRDYHKHNIDPSNENKTSDNSNLNNHPVSLKKDENSFTENFDIRKIHRAELFILFNPFIIFTSSIKGQFDILPAIFLFLGWNQFKHKNYGRSGIYIGTAVLFKQYGILFSIVLGLNLLKTNFRKLPRLIGGHLFIAIPVLSIVALINFEGLLYHSIQYHLDRPPSGYSLVSIIYYPLVILSRINYSSIFGVVVGNLIELLFFSILLAALLYIFYRFWNSPNNIEDVLNALLLSYFAFFWLNNVLWVQYFAIFMALWVENKLYKGEEIPIEPIYWNYVIIPLTVAFRVVHMTSVEVQEILGKYWLIIIWFASIITHFYFMYNFRKRGIDMFKYKYAKILYTIILIIMPFHLLIMIAFSDILNGVVFTNPL